MKALWLKPKFNSGQNKQPMVPRSSQVDCNCKFLFTQGVRIAAQSHEARVLSEAQEIDAVPLAL